MQMTQWSSALLDGVRALEGGILPPLVATPQLQTQGIPANLPGAWVGLVGERLSLQLGLVAEFVTLELLTANMIGRHEELSDVEITDAVAEVVNVIGGVAKRLVIEADPSLRSGLPMFLFGRLRVPTGTTSEVFRLSTELGEMHLVSISDSGDEG
ncbi:MAG: chemotaxis protein CheX [Ferrimicrobium sp.]|uniref:chemotaxis protein CheX n=2 Tax=Ferrimicrobium sp. TaxID=2926050 RepID=UPI00262CD80D|nr:chemotaxis protein CheX [Ferrimicrobium sp.]